MRKLRSNSAWCALSAEQKATVESWLFEKHLSFKQVLELVTAELGMKTSLTSLKMFGRRLEGEREGRLARTEVLEWIKGDGGGEKLQKLRSGAEVLAMAKMLELTALGPGNGFEMAALLRAITANQGIELETKRLRLAADEPKREAAFDGNLSGGEGGNAAKVSFGQLKSG